MFTIYGYTFLTMVSEGLLFVSGSNSHGHHTLLAEEAKQDI